MAGLSTAAELMKQLVRHTGVVILISSLLGMLMFAFLHFNETTYFPVLTSRPGGFLISSLMGTVVGLALYYLNRQLNRWLPWRRAFAARFIAGYLSNLILAMTLALLLAEGIRMTWGSDIFWNGFSGRDTEVNIKVSILMSTIVFIYTIVYALLYSYQQYAVAQLESLQQERRQMELQFEALKSQLSPHYLFNSLNTISSLIFKDPQSAEQFIRRLAQTYHYILSTQRSRYVTLRQEVEFVQSYYYLLRIRFQQQLNLEINLPNSILNSKIPPLTLQILVENAVKHNMLHSDQKLFIYISARDNTELKVINTKLGNSQSITSFRLGLENIRKRYEFFTHRKIEIRDETQFSVILPVIPNREEEYTRAYKHSA